MLIWGIIIGIAVFMYRRYGELAFEYNKSRGGFGALGEGIFIVGYFVIAFLIGILIAIAKPEMLSDVGTIFIFEFGVIGLAAGLAAIVRAIMKKSWAKQRASAEVLDQDQISGL